MRFLLLLLLYSILTGCNQSPSAPTNAQPQPATSNAAAATFQFSKKAAATDLKNTSSWCNGAFTDAVLINADPANSKRRYFLLGEGVYNVAVQLGNATSSFFLQKTGGQAIEIFTSDNFPLCSSNRVNFSVAAEGAWFRYDNNRGINYTVESKSSPEGLFIILEFPDEITYGLTAYHCVGCR